MDILVLLDELQILARNGLHYAQNPYDRERYSRILELASHYYGRALDLPPTEVRQRLVGELGHITPKVGAAAAVYDAAGNILLMQRADNGLWCLPGGWTEPHESPASTAVRETYEETGLDVRVVQLVDVFTRRPGSHTSPHAVVVVIYLCERIGGTLQCSPEGLELRYWPLDEVPAWQGNHHQYALTAAALWRTRQVRQP